jgi:uncharacterized protein (DUF697 family)
LVDLAIIPGIQIAMVESIGRIRGHAVDGRSILAMIKALRSGLFTSQAVVSTAKVVPVFGSMLAAPMAYTLTSAVGQVSDFYFRTGQTASKAALQAVFKRAMKAARHDQR